MTAPTICLFNKFGYCKFGERCRKHHIYKICEESSCEIFSCRQRHPKDCRYFRKFGRCKFSPCAFNHETVVHGNVCEDMRKEIKILSDKILALENVISCQNLQIEEMNTKIQNIETKLTQKDENSLFEKIEEKLKHIEKKFELVDETNETFSNFVVNTCSNIDDLVVELNDDIGNITIENENQLTRTFDNPFRWKCDFCEFIAKSERGLKTHITRKHEICDWCEFVCADKSEMKTHKMEKHRLQYSKEVLEVYIGNSP